MDMKLNNMTLSYSYRKTEVLFVTSQLFFLFAYLFCFPCCNGTFLQCDWTQSLRLMFFLGLCIQTHFLVATPYWRADSQGPRRAFFLILLRFPFDRQILISDSMGNHEKQLFPWNSFFHSNNMTNLIYINSWRWDNKGK